VGPIAREETSEGSIILSNCRNGTSPYEPQYRDPPYITDLSKIPLEIKVKDIRIVSVTNGFRNLCTMLNPSTFRIYLSGQMGNEAWWTLDIT
jgi:hypothetical protein